MIILFGVGGCPPIGEAKDAGVRTVTWGARAVSRCEQVTVIGQGFCNKSKFYKTAGIALLHPQSYNRIVCRCFVMLIVT